MFFLVFKEVPSKLHPGRLYWCIEDVVSATNLLSAVKILGKEIGIRLGMDDALLLPEDGHAVRIEAVEELFCPWPKK